MALDFFAIVSNGAYPTPGVTTTQRAAFGASYGLFPTITTIISAFLRGISKFGFSLRT